MVIFIVITSIVLIVIPYKFSSKKLISRNNYDYTYIQLRVLDLDLDIMDDPIWINNTDAGEVDKLVGIIDDLSVKKTIRPMDWPNYGITFVATYKKDDGITYTEPTFTIRFYENYVIGFKEEYTYREKYYKIQDKSFDIKKIIEELQEE